MVTPASLVNGSASTVIVWGGGVVYQSLLQITKTVSSQACCANAAGPCCCNTAGCCLLRLLRMLRLT